MSITDDRARRVFVLQVAGLPIRYTSSDFDPTTSNMNANITTGIAYEDVQAIVGVGAFSANVDPSGGIANYDAVSITLASDRLRGTLTDPSVIFGRCGARATGASRAQITTDLTYASDSGVVSLDTDPTTFISSVPTLLHIGAETIRVNALTTSSISYDVRAVGSSQRQGHQITQEGVNVPEVSTAITTFRGRRASLWVADQYPGGKLSDFSQIINGFIESSPIVEDGGTVSISLMPLTALLDTSYSVKSESTKLVHGFHYFGENANYLEWALKVTGFDAWTIYYSSVDTVAGEFDFNMPLDMYWFGAPTDLDTGFDKCHPRYPILNGFNAKIYPLSINGTRVTYDIANTSPNPLVNTIFTSERGSLPQEPEIKQVQLGINTVKRFPEVISDELNNFGPTSITGVDGGIGKWQLSADQHITFQPNQKSLVQAQLLLRSNPMTQVAVDGVGYYPRRWGADSTYQPLSRVNRLWYPIDIRSLDDQAEPDNHPLNDSPNGRNITSPFDARTLTIREPVRDIARGYYQWRENQILVEDQLFWLPSAATPGDYYWIEVKYYDRVAGETRSQFMKATHQTSASFDGSVIGYLIHLDARQNWDELCSFGDWSEGDRVEIYAAARFDRERPGELILKLLQSGGGGLKNGSYDRLSMGLSLHYTNMNEASFRAYDASSPFVFSGSISSDGLDLRDLIDSLLKTMGCVMIMKRQLDGTSAIYLQPLGAERAEQTDHEISAEDWLADNPPTWSIYEDVVTQTEIKYDWSPEKQDFNITAVYNNQEAINRYGGERSKVSLELYALTARDIGGTAGDTFGFFLPVISRIWQLLSNPLRLWKGSIGTGKSMLLDVGSYVSVSSPLLKGYGDEWGVTDEIGMIQNIHQELMSEGAQIEIIQIGLAPVAWNQSARVIAITSATQLEIEQDIYSDADIDDSSFFRAGNFCDYVPEGDQDNFVSLPRISAIAGNVLTFLSAHGVTTTGGTLEASAYASSQPIQRRDAYLASDTSPPVLPFSVEAQRYS